jgi:hypothetical protein
LVYKKDVEPVDPVYSDKALSDLQPIWYRSTAKADNPDYSWYGLAAEDVAQVDPRLVHWGYQDDAYEEYEHMDPSPDGDPNKTGVITVQKRLKTDAQLKPDGVMYDRVAILQIAALKRIVEAQDKRITQLESLQPTSIN